MIFLKNIGDIYHFLIFLVYQPKKSFFQTKMSIYQCSDVVLCIKKKKGLSMHRRKYLSLILADVCQNCQHWTTHNC